MRVTKAYLGLGTNLGERENFLREARAEIQAAFPGARFSPIYETEPVGVVEQPWFLNQVAEIKTDETPFGLLKWCLDLEHRQGRVRLVDKGPRTLDVDVLLFGGLTVQTDSLTVPHPRLLERRFVLLPLSDLAPEILIPGVGQTVDEALKKVLNTAQVRPFEGRSMTC
jgi:2-amino-4-hydroxy-6-hydroxymethyldihydropteridine diphosphokinase